MAGRATEAKALLVSDIHFDPFFDPSKVKQLADAPVDRWEAILTAPAPDSTESYRQLLQECGTKGADTPFALLKSSLDEMKARAGDAKFVTVTGDLMAHSFACKTQKTLPGADAAEQAEFAAKTVEFVAHALRASLPGVPVYFALGNNDSDCGDYRLDVHGRFFSAIAPAMTADVPAAQRAQAVEDFSADGSYAVNLPAPIASTQLLVVDDTFMAPKFSNCSGKDDRAGETLTLDWLGTQLAEAQAAHKNVWVMGHIPPGIDVKGSMAHGITVCGKPPKSYLDSPKLADEITGQGDIVKLALFGHTHMDEMHLLTPAGSDPQAGSVAMKIVPSITPINGNRPSFLIAEIDPASAQLVDYQMIAASSADPATLQWSELYDYQQTYRQTGFNANAMTHLAADFRADRLADKPASDAYIRNFMAGSEAGELLRFVWPAYACSLSSQDPAAFSSCACPK